jgi:small subunit ribosomal protein S4
MPAIRGPRNKLSRREGVDLFGNGGESLQRRLGQLPGQHSRQPQRQQSEYARQLREKQKVKRMYGMREAQFQRFFQMALKTKGVTGTELLKLLERRLDNVVYRLGFTRTRFQSRQLVVHGHVLVDGHKVDRPSFLVEPGMTITLHPKARRIPSVQELIESSVSAPTWLERGDGAGRVVREPERAEIDDHINETAIIEFYSR